MVSSNCAGDGRSEISDSRHCLFRGRVLQDNAKFGEIRVQPYEVFQEVSLRIQYTGILWGMWFRVTGAKGALKILPTVLGSEGISPCKFRTIPSSSMVLNTS